MVEKQEMVDSAPPKGSDERGEPPPQSEASGARDVAIIHGVTADGQGLKIVRFRDDHVELGAARPLEEGKPIHGEVVSLKPRPEFPLICDVRVQYSQRQPQEQGKAAPEPVASPKPAQAQRQLTPRPARRGPAQVATDAYRANWDEIWRPKRGDLPN
jgi:hypothetical protein